MPWRAFTGVLPGSDFVVEKKDLSQYSVLPSPSLSLDDGQILARVESFALTSNNITYAAAGAPQGQVELLSEPGR